MANPFDYGRPLRVVWGLLARFFFRPDGNALRDLATDGAEGIRKEARHMPKIIWEPAPLEVECGRGLHIPEPVTGGGAQYYRDAQPGVAPDDCAGPPADDSPGSPWQVRRALATPGLLRQTDDVTCGAASVIVARMLCDEPYARMILTGDDARTGHVDPGGTSVGSVRARFAEQSSLVHARSSRALAAGPSPQSRGWLGSASWHPRLPWPRALGTAPWAIRDELSRFRRRRYRVALVDSDSPASRQSAYEALTNASAAGIPSALFTGNNSLPRHVVLVLGTDVNATDLQVYDPGKGVVVGLSRSEFLSDLGGVSWTRPWAVVLPDG